MVWVGRNEMMEKLLKLKAQDYNEEKAEGYGLECDKCKNKGYIAKVVDGELIYKMCSCYDKRKLIKQKNNEPSAPPYNKYTLDNFYIKTKEQSGIKATIQEYINSKNVNNNWLYIGGKVGSGKTHLANAVYDKLLIRGKKSKYINYFVLQKIGRNLKSFNEITKNESMNLYEEIINANVLLIDDIFKNKERNDEAQALVWEILNTRYLNSNSITIITAEKTPQTLFAEDESLFSRIFERCENGKYMLSIEKEVLNYRLK